MHDMETQFTVRRQLLKRIHFSKRSIHNAFNPQYGHSINNLQIRFTTYKFNSQCIGNSSKEFN